MHSRRSFLMRGGSVVGAVLVVALLSAAAVMIDSSRVAVNSQTQTAAGVPSVSATVSNPLDASARMPTCVTIDGKEICNGITIGSAEYKNLTCQIGNDFIVRMNPDGTDPVLYFSDSSGKVSQTKSQCKSISSETWVPARQDGGKNLPARQCTQAAWKCYIKICFRSSEQGATAKDTRCILRDDKAIPLGEKVANSDDIIASARPTGPDSGSVPSDLGQYGQSADKTIQDINKSNEPASVKLEQLGAEEKKYQEQISELKDLKEGHQERLEALTYECDELSTDDCERAKSFSREQIAAADQKIAETERQMKLLADAKVSLQPTVLCVKAPCPGDTQAPPNNDASRRGVWTGSGNPLDFILRNSNQEDEYRRQLYAACQAGSDRACQEYLGQTGAYGAYGARPSGGQQGCNSNSGMGGGGIFGTIISLVMRGIGGGNSSGGCNNNSNGSNAPTPSCTITATPRTVGKGQAVTLSWQSERGFSAILSSSGSVAPTGSMTVNPQTTTTYSLQVNGYIDNRTGQQLRGECSTQVIVDGEGGGTGSPKAEISCRPEVADVGMQVAVSFACANSSVSAGNGFSTDNQMSGSATPTIENPTIGTTNAIFGVTCSREGKTDTAQCTIAINKTSMVLIANPKNVESGAQANVGWVTSGMQECTISSPTLSGFTAENAGNTATSGLAKTPVLNTDTEFELSCTTKSGVVKTAKTTVVVD